MIKTNLKSKPQPVIVNSVEFMLSQYASIEINTKCNQYVSSSARLR